jgi:hypothetical protein
MGSLGFRPGTPDFLANFSGQMLFGDKPQDLAAGQDRGAVVNRIPMQDRQSNDDNYTGRFPGQGD